MSALVDTSVLVAAERAKRGVVEAVAPHSDVAISVITAVELWRGVERSGGVRQRRQREDLLISAAGRFQTLPLDGEMALTAAELWVDLERQGVVIPLFDLLIAATAVVSERTLLTADAKHFPRVNGLEVQLIETA